MSNGNPLERLWRLQAKVNMLISDGKRDPKAVADVYQSILDGTAGRSWREENGIIYFSVVSDGTTGEDWIKSLEGQGFRVEGQAKQVLRSPDFKPTSGVTTEVAVLKGARFGDSDRIIKNIRTVAYAGILTQGRKLFKPNAELACLIREKFRDKEIEAMGLWRIISMHEPINDLESVPYLLHASRTDHGRQLGAHYDRPYGLSRTDGFAFAVSQVNSQH